MNQFQKFASVSLMAGLLMNFTNGVFAQNTFPATGNVGIGTSTPLTPLEVNGSIRSSNLDGRYLNLSAPEDGNSYVNYQGGDENSRIGFQIDGGSKMSITKNGNVGIGTVIPNAPLEVRGIVRSSFSNDRYLNLNTAADGNSYINYQGGDENSRLGFQIDGGSKMSVTINGVGVGTVTPNAPLDVQGSIRTSVSDTRYLSFATTADGNSYINYQGGGVNSRLGFQIDGGSRMSIMENGSVGIGTISTGSHKLAVEGTIGARGIKVSGGAWPDFVFESNYGLRPLKEVKNFIKENKHLPEIPSQSEVDKNGIDLGQMDAKLLQKIEELTLYMIELSERVNELEVENKALKNK